MGGVSSRRLCLPDEMGVVINIGLFSRFPRLFEFTTDGEMAVGSVTESAYIGTEYKVRPGWAG